MMINETKTTEIKAKVSNFAGNTVTQTIADVSAGMARAAAGFEQTQTKLAKNAESAMTKAAELAGGNFEAFTKSSKIWVAGVQDLSRQVAASMQSSMVQTTGVMKSLTTVKSLKEAIELQSGFARTTLEKALFETDRLTRASLKLTEQTLAPVAERVRIAGEVLTKAVNPA